MKWVKIQLWGFAGYTALVILSAGESALSYVQHAQPIPWGNIVIGRALEEYTCALAVVPIFWLVDRFPIDRQRWQRNAPILVAACFALAFLKYLIFYPIFVAWWNVPPRQIPALVVSYAMQVAVDFAWVVIVAHAVRYYQREHERERTEAALRLRLSETQLEALKSQLHPHFLFNTLNSVASLMHWDVAAADEMVTQLSDLLRETLRHPGTHEIPLSEELSLIERYLSIVRARFQDRLTVVYDIAAEVRTARVPHFILQPLVENALEHGIALQPGPGRVAISADRDGDRLRIAVLDDGPGLSSETANGNGVGLTNTRARLAELYGAGQSVTLEPAAPRGALVTVVLPYHV